MWNSSPPFITGIIKNISFPKTAVLGVRSLSWLFTENLQRGLTAEILTGLVVTVLLALVLDGLVVLGGRVLMSWTRGLRAGAQADQEDA